MLKGCSNSHVYDLEQPFKQYIKISSIWLHASRQQNLAQRL